MPYSKQDVAGCLKPLDHNGYSRKGAGGIGKAFELAVQTLGTIVDEKIIMQ